MTEYVDSAIEAGKAYTYQIRTVTPLRIKGPLSPQVKVAP